MCLVSNITDVTIDIVSENVIPNVCHWRMVAESKFDKKHLRTDNGCNVDLSHSPNREPRKLWVSVQIFLCRAHCMLYISSCRDFRFELLKNIGIQGKLFKTNLKWPQLAGTASAGYLLQLGPRQEMASNPQVQWGQRHWAMRLTEEKTGLVTLIILPYIVYIIYIVKAIVKC